MFSPARADAPPPAKGIITELVRRKVAKYVSTCNDVLCVISVLCDSVLYVMVLCVIVCFM